MKMFRFSCFPAHIPSHKHKKTVRVSGEGMRKVREDSSQNKIMSEISGLVAESMPYTDEVLPNKNTESVINCPLMERECNIVNCDSMRIKNGKLRKSISLGSVLNWEERSGIAEGAEEEVEQRLSDNVSVDQSGVAVRDGIHVPDVTDKYQEQVASDSLHGGSDFSKNISVFSIGGTQPIEKEDADNVGVGSPFVVDLSSPAIQPRSVIVRSSSLPKMGSPSQSPVFFLPQSRSAEDLSAPELKKPFIRHEFGLQMNFEETEKLHDENLVDDTDENYNFVDSAKHWIVPEHDMANTEMVPMGDTCSVQPWSEAPTGDFKLKRIEQWVANLQYTGPLDETADPAPSSDHQELSKVDTSLEKAVATKLDVSLMPGSEMAKHYISSLSASTTTAHLSNLGLVLIPFLSAFVSLKALNLSGNAIVRIAAGALPRGLHILNISKNSISTIEGLRNLTRLRVLDLSYNRILRIGHGLAGCSSLKELYLAGNKISEVEGLHRLLKLNVLDLRFNKISTTKSLDQLAANYNCLHALSLEGNPAQKNIGDEQLKKHLVSLLPNLTYYNRQPVKVRTMKDGMDRSARLGISSHQMDRSARVEVKNMRKGTAGRRVVPAKAGSSSKQVRPHPTVMRSSQQHPLSVFKNEVSFPRSRSEGNLGFL